MKISKKNNTKNIQGGGGGEARSGVELGRVRVDVNGEVMMFL